MKIKIYNKFLFSACIIFITSQSGFSQLTVDVGKDTVYCTNPYTDKLILGDNVKIGNGIEPYTIAWECNVNTFIGRKTASDLLNDSTLVSPFFKNGVWLYVEKVDFILKVVDHEGNVAKDTINVVFSKCGCTSGYTVIELIKGDSVWINAGTPGGRIAAFYWEPSEGLTNPDSAATWCKPDKTTSYNIVSVDTFGCHCSCQALEVRVAVTGSISLELNPNLNLKQVGKSIRFDNYLNDEAHISLYSLNGNLLYKTSIESNMLDLSHIIPPGKGIYIVKVSIGNYIATCKLLNN